MLNTQKEELFTRIQKTKKQVSLLLDTIQKISIIHETQLDDLKTIFNQDIRSLALIELDQKKVYLVKYRQNHPDLLVQAKLNEVVRPEEQIPAIDQIRGWPSVEKRDDQASLKARRKQFIFDLSFMLTKVLLTTIGENLTTFQKMEQQMRDLKKDTLRQTDDITDKVATIQRLKLDLDQLKEKQEKLEKSLREKDQEITCLKKELRKVNTKSTLYRDSKTNAIIETNATNLQSIETNEIVSLGFYPDDYGFILLPKMPRSIRKVPNYLPREVTSLDNTFEGAYYFDQDLSSWDVSNVTSMVSMFRENPWFNKNLSNWDVSNVEDMAFMFSSAKRFNNGGGATTHLR